MSSGGVGEVIMGRLFTFTCSESHAKPDVRTEEGESAVGRLDVGKRPVAWLPSADSACLFGGRR